MSRAVSLELISLCAPTKFYKGCQSRISGTTSAAVRQNSKTTKENHEKREGKSGPRNHVPQGRFLRLREGHQRRGNQTQGGAKLHLLADRSKGLPRAGVYRPCIGSPCRPCC